MKLNYYLLLIFFPIIIVAEEMPKYNDFIKINEIPMDLNSLAMLMCRDPRLDSGPHLALKTTFYINSKALNSSSGIMDIGSIIIKEKKGPNYPGNIQGEIVTVMTKISNSGNINDWEFKIYSLLDGMDLTKKYIESGSTSCLDCHSKFSNNYLSNVFNDALGKYKSIKQ